MKQSKYMKFNKCPSWVNWKEINKRITTDRRARRRKKEFMGRLKHGKRFRRTRDPGPY